MLYLKGTRNNCYMSLKLSPETKIRGLTSAFAVQLYLVTLPDNNLKKHKNQHAISL